MRTIVYVDGLNLYYGALKGTPYKWLDLKKLAQEILGPQNDIIKIKLFTAAVKPTSTDPHVHLRQSVYLRALEKFIPEIEIMKGHFLEHTVSMRLDPPIGTKKFATVLKREEKGSDVNLALHFLNDAWLNHYDCGVIISNDSDLAEAVRLVRMQTTKKIGIISPFPTTSKELSNHSHFQRKIRENALTISQLPDQIPNTNIKKPDRWKTITE